MKVAKILAGAAFAMLGPGFATPIHRANDSGPRSWPKHRNPYYGPVIDTTPLTKREKRKLRKQHG